MNYVYFGAVEAKWNLERLLQEYTINDLRKMSGICGIPEKSRKENLQSVNKYIIENKFDLYTTLNEVSKKGFTGNCS